MKDYYVYEWIRLDTLEPFYVGKGRDDRAYSFKSRNKHFNDIIKYCDRLGIDYAVNILESNLTEEDYDVIRRKISESLKGRKFTEDTRKKFLKVKRLRF